MCIHTQQQHRPNQTRIDAAATPLSPYHPKAARRINCGKRLGANARVRAQTHTHTLQNNLASTPLAASHSPPSHLSCCCPFSSPSPSSPPRKLKTILQNTHRWPLPTSDWAAVCGGGRARRCFTAPFSLYPTTHTPLTLPLCCARVRARHTYRPL